MVKNSLIKTKIPGPNSLRLFSQKKQYVSNGLDMDYPVFIKSAKGSILTDVDGNRFIDFAGGIGALNSGHSNRKIISAMKKQSGKLVHTSFTILGYNSYVELCKKLNQITGQYPKKSFLANSGAEAVENAIKIARKYTGRQAIVSFDHSFHGRTLLTMSLTSKIKPYKLGFGPFAPEVYKLPYPYTYRMPSSCLTEDEYINYLINDIEETFFKAVVAPENIAAIIIELVAGEGGFIVSPKRYIQKLYRVCKKYKILFIVDEVQTGFGRTGKMFSYMNYNIKPDLITMAKSLSNGLPLSAVTGKSKIMDSVHPGGIGGTFGGNPVACEAAIAAIDFIKKNNLAGKARQIGKIVMSRFNEFKEKYEFVGDARGLGAMCAIEIVKDKKSKKPDKNRTERIAKLCYQNGLILLSAGILGNDLRTLMPLVINKNELSEGLDIIDHALKNS